MSVTPYPPEFNDKVVTSWIPLKTAWPLSPGCSSYFRLEDTSLVAFDPGYGLDVDTSVRCGPPAVTTWWEQGRLGAGDQYHTAISIGPLTCPDYLYTVGTSIKDGFSTLAMCCPKGYILSGIAPNVKFNGECLSTVSSGMTLTYASTGRLNNGYWIIETTTLSRNSAIGAIAVLGWNIDRPVSSTTATSTTTTTASTPETPSSTDTSPTETTPTVTSPMGTSSTDTSPTSMRPLMTSSGPFSKDSPSPISSTTTSPIVLLPTSSFSIITTMRPSQTFSEEGSENGLSISAKAGIGVGAGLGTILLIALLFALCTVMRKKRGTINYEPTTFATILAPTSSRGSGYKFAQRSATAIPTTPGVTRQPIAELE